MVFTELIEKFRQIFLPETEIYQITKNGVKYTITKKGDIKFFKVNGLVYSELNNKSIYTDSYHDKFLLLPMLYTKPRVLLIGLGAGTTPFQMSKMYKNRVIMDVVELDSTYEPLTKRFLPKNVAKFNLTIGSGEEFVTTQRSKYDIIIQDAYSGANIPDVFFQHKFMSDAYSALKNDGILAINYAADTLYLPIYLRNLRKHFPHVYRIVHISLGNYVIICSKKLNKKQIVEKITSNTNAKNLDKDLLKSYKSMR